MMNKLYPLKFEPILKEMIWGGNKIPERLNITYDNALSIGELFAISGLKNDCSIVQNGSLKGRSLDELIDVYREELVGKNVFEKFGKEFPLLIKLIDANDDLSVQVHPNDEQAKLIQGGNGKTEMWYVIDSEDDAKLISGFNKPLTANEFNSAFSKGELMDVMGVHKTQSGDTFFIPAGKVHSIGKGNFIAEIQQTSDITYRIYDFDRTDKKGNKRELHNEQALSVMNFNDASSGKVNVNTDSSNVNNLVNCQYFTTNLITGENEIIRDYSDLSSFKILINTGEPCDIVYGDENIKLKALETLLVPASIEVVKVLPTTICEILEVYVK